jgi:hypothetical protein
MKSFGLTLLSAMLFFLVTDCSQARNILPEEGGEMPEISFPPPFAQAEREALGLSADTPEFKISDIKTDLILIEVIGVYCPVCFKQAPGLNDLYARLGRGKAKGRVTMFALAAGSPDTEIQPLIQSGQYKFPIVSDVKFEAHKLLGEPKTPFTIICRPNGSILYTHLGLIDNIDEIYAKIKSFL